MKTEDLEKQKKQDFDIIVLAGQSNAEGYGLGNEELIYKVDKKIFQIADKNKFFYKEGDTKLQITLPMEKEFSLVGERIDDNGKIAGGFYQSFVRKYIEDGKLKKGRKLLLLKGAVGGSGFSRNEWGKQGFLYTRLKDLIDYALSLGGKNKIVALLWHQGEHDAFEQNWLNYKERFDYYYSQLLQQMQDFRNVYGNVPIIAGDFVKDNAKTIKKPTKAIEKATRKVLKQLKNSGVAKSNGLKSNDQVLHNGDRIHFCRKSAIEFGKRYYKIFRKLTKNK